MDPFGRKTTPLAVVVALVLAVRAHKRKTLTPSGATIGCLVGFLIVSTGLRGMNLFFFYQLGSWATKYKKHKKEKKKMPPWLVTIRFGEDYKYWRWP